MQAIGYSSGAIAFGDFRGALALLRKHDLTAIELSALREGELRPLVDALPDLCLERYEYMSVHAPSAIRKLTERDVVHCLHDVPDHSWPIIVHPDVVTDPSLWRGLGERLCFENIDKRKPIARTAKDLRDLFSEFPKASLCFDIGHARQIDPTMCVAAMILREQKHRIRQIHISEVDTQSRHRPMSLASQLAFEKVVPNLPDDVPIIIESITPPDAIAAEVRAVRALLSRATRHVLLTD